MAKKSEKNSSAGGIGSLFGGKVYVGGGEKVFDPVGIIIQIIAMQFIYYTFLSLSIIFMDFVSGLRCHSG